MIGQLKTKYWNILNKIFVDDAQLSNLIGAKPRLPQ
jgi:hypothetical protein